MSIVVSNASPLIILAMIDQLDRLKDLFGAVRISTGVHAEVVIRGRGKPGAEAVSRADFIVSETAADPPQELKLAQANRIGLGEASTLILAKRLRAELVLIDDKQARAAARALGLAFIGSVRVLELAHERGFMPDLRDTYRRLRTSPARIHPAILSDSLSRHGFDPLPPSS